MVGCELVQSDVLLLEDGVAALKGYQDGIFDMIVSDPPYYRTNVKFDRKKKRINYPSLFQEYRRVLKDDGWLFLFGPAELFCTAHTNGWKRQFDYVWLKPSIIPPYKGQKKPAQKHDNLWALIKSDLKRVGGLYFDSSALESAGKPYTRHFTGEQTIGVYERVQNYRPTDEQGRLREYTVVNEGKRTGSTILEYPNKNRMKKEERTDHPTQKPLALMEKLILGYCPPGGIVLDNFVGSGTTIEACLKTGRHYVAYENDAHNYETCKNRMERAHRE